MITTAKSPAIGSIITIGAGLMVLIAIIGVAVAFSGVIESTYMKLAFETPKFEYSIVDGEETGNEMLEIYKTMRIASIFLFVMVLIFAGINRVLESSDLGIIQQGTANKMISKSLLFLLVIFIFPPLWDIAADGMTNASYWVLNPLYSFGHVYEIKENGIPVLDADGNPESVILQCPYEWGLDPGGTFNKAIYDNKVLEHYTASPYIPDYQKAQWIAGGHQSTIDENDKQRPDAISSVLHGGNKFGVKFNERVIIDPTGFQIEITSKREIKEITTYYDKALVKFDGPPVSQASTVDFSIGGVTNLKTQGSIDTSSLASILSANITKWDDKADPKLNEHTLLIAIDREERIPPSQIDNIIIDGENEEREIISREQYQSEGVNEITVTFSGPSADGKGASIYIGTGDRDVRVQPLNFATEPARLLNVDGAQLYGKDTILIDFSGPVDPDISPSDLGGTIIVTEDRQATHVSGNYTDTAIVIFDGSSVTAPGVNDVQIDFTLMETVTDINGNVIARNTGSINTATDPDAITSPTIIHAAVIATDKVKIIFSVPVKITGNLHDSFKDIIVYREGSQFGAIRDVRNISGNGSDTIIVAFDVDDTVSTDPEKRFPGTTYWGANGGDTVKLTVGGDYIIGAQNGETMPPTNITAVPTNFRFDATGPDSSGWGNPEFVCDPQFKLNYVFQQMLRDTHDTETGVPIGLVEGIQNDLVGTNLDEANDWTSDILGYIQQGSPAFLFNIFVGLTKALVALQILILSLMVGIMADMLTAMIAAGLPVFLMLSLIPKVEEVANKMINCLPALLLLPLMSAIIVVVGAAAVAEAGADDPVQGHIYTWITSIGVVFFAVMIPVILVPLLGNVVQSATQIVSSAVSTGAIITGMATSSAGTAMRDMTHYSRAPGSAGILGSDKSEFQQQGGYKKMLKSGMGGLASGLSASHGMVGMPKSGMGDTGIEPAKMESAIRGGIASGHARNPEAAQYLSTNEQEKIATARIDEFAKKGYTKENVDSLAGVMKQQKTGDPDSMKWDSGKTFEDNQTSINANIRALRTAMADSTGNSSSLHEEIRNVQGSVYELKEMEGEKTSSEIQRAQSGRIIDEIEQGDAQFKDKITSGNKIASLNKYLSEMNLSNSE